MPQILHWSIITEYSTEESRILLHAPILVKGPIKEFPMANCLFVIIGITGDLAKKKSLRLFSDLEKNGILVAESFGRGSLKAQLRVASRLGVEVTIILGQKEALDETAIVKATKE